jgi:hypothetical protein
MAPQRARTIREDCPCVRDPISARGVGLDDSIYVEAVALNPCSLAPSSIPIAMDLPAVRSTTGWRRPV